MIRTVIGPSLKVSPALVGTKLMWFCGTGRFVGGPSSVAMLDILVPLIGGLVECGKQFELNYPSEYIPPAGLGLRYTIPTLCKRGTLICASQHDCTVIALVFTHSLLGANLARLSRGFSPSRLFQTPIN